MGRKLEVLSSVLAGLMIVAGPAYALDGDLDLAFGFGGTAVLDFSGRVDSASAIAIQPDGKIVVAGSSGNDFALARYNSNGSIDRSFGVGGRVITDLTGDDALFEVVSALSVQADGKILAAGSASSRLDDHSGLLARYNSDGSLDTTFGAGGKLFTDLFFGQVLALPDGKIIGAGYAYDRTIRFSLARYNNDGSLDSTFAGGMVGTSFPGYDGSSANALAMQSDGKIVAGGFASYRIGPDYYSDFVLARYNNDGLLDSSFGLGGKVVTDISRADGLSRLALQADGKVVTAGYSIGVAPSYDFVHARYNSDGSLDSTFGLGGKAITDLSGSGDEYFDTAIQFDGRIVLAGWGEFGTFVLRRSNSNGSPDLTFGPGGTVRTAFPTAVGLAAVGANAVAIQPDGKILAAGYSGGDFALARYTSAEPVRVVFDPASLRIGSSFTATFLGPNLTNDTYFDVRYRSPGSGAEQVVLNWQQGISAFHGVPIGTAAGAWTITGIRSHQGINDPSGDFHASPATLNVNPMQVTSVHIDGGGSFRAGDSFTVTFSGTNLTNATYFDVRFRSPNGNTDQVAVNWQQGTSASHIVPVGALTGTWTITGVWAHESPVDHSTDFAPVSATLNVAP